MKFVRSYIVFPARSAGGNTYSEGDRSLMRNWMQRILLLTLLLVTFSAKAQDNAAMAGTVTDASGAVVANATVVLTNPSRGLSFTAKTNGEGTYRFPNVPPAPSYRATFSHEGFATETISKSPSPSALPAPKTRNFLLEATRLSRLPLRTALLR